MKKNGYLYIARVLIIIAFGFLTTGAYIEINNRLSWSDPKKAVVSLNMDKIAVTPVDRNHNLGGSSNGLEEETHNNNDSNPAIVNPEVQDPTPIDPVSPVSPISPNPSVEEPQDEPLKEKTPDISVEEANLVLKQRIEANYGISVLYGGDTVGYTVGGISVDPLKSASDINLALTQLNNALETYPSGFFQEFSNNDYSTKLNLKILLVKRFLSSGKTGSITGLTAFGRPQVTISIAMDYPFLDSFYHEVYHYMEYFMQLNGANFVSWLDLNPEGFIYGGEANPNLSYNKTLSPEAYFVNNYAQTSKDEDRASTFEYMSASSKAGCYDSNLYPIWKKSNYIANTIDAYFSSVSPSITEYWERFLY